MVIMELLVGALVTLGGAALLLQSKALPSEVDAVKAKATIDKDPLDPAANTTLGKYMAFVDGDYTGAMSYLVHSDNKTLKSLAEHELDTSFTETSAQKVGMGDEWVKAARSFPALNRIFYDRASQWYGLAWPALDSIWKDRTRIQLRKILQNPTIADPKTLVVPSGWKAYDNAQKGAPTSKASRNGKNSYQVMGAKTATGTMVSPIEQAISVTPGKEAEVTAWVLSDGTESVQDHVSLGFWGQGGRLLDAKPLNLRPDEPWWQKLSLKFTIPKDSILIRLQLVLDSKSGTVFFDDISVKVDGKELVKNGSFEDK